MSQFPDLSAAEPEQPLESAFTLASDWEVEACRRILTVIGGQNDADEFKRAQGFYEEFKHFFPNAKGKWDAYAHSLGLE